jgi:hypothetical protein
VFNQDITRHKVKTHRSRKNKKDSAAIDGSEEGDNDDLEEDDLEEEDKTSIQKEDGDVSQGGDSTVNNKGGSSKRNGESTKNYNKRNGSDTTSNKEAGEVKKLKRKMQVEISSKVMKRPHLLIMEKIRTKLENMLKSKIGEEYGKNILMALKDKGIEKDIKTLMKGDKIQIHNEQNQPVYKKQISLAAGVVDDNVAATP